MAIQNIDKPPATTPPHLNIGSGFNLLVGGAYKLLIGLSGGGFTNTDKTSVGETWGTIETTWGSETRTWLAVSQLFTNIAMSSTDPLWSTRTFPWQEPLPWQNANSGVTNISKP